MKRHMENERGRYHERVEGRESGAARVERDEETSREDSKLRYTLSESIIMIISYVVYHI